MKMKVLTLFLLLLLSVAPVACAAPVQLPSADQATADSQADTHGGEHTSDEHAAHEHEAEDIHGHETAIADLQPVSLNGRLLRVVATTSLVGDVVQRVGGDRVELTVLLPSGADPHAYVATPNDLVTLSEADLIFVNGLALEESLLPTLEELDTAPFVSVNEGVVPIGGGDHADGDHADGEHTDGEHAHDDGHVHEENHEHIHAGGDPHTWQDVRNVARWSLNAGAALARVDPANAEGYTQAAEAYAEELNALDEEVRTVLSGIPEDRRKLVTDHDMLAYFARAYDFEIIGSVIPSFSSLATISARDMAQLQDQIRAAGAQALLVGNTANPAMAEQVAADTGIPVVTLYTDSLGAPGTPGDSYVGMVRANVAALASALQE